MTETVETRWEVHNDAGRRFFSQNEYAQAEQEFIAAIREATLLGADNARLATSLSNLAQLKYRQKDLAQAEALFRRSLAIRERVLGGDDAGLVQNINNLAALHYSRGELAQAEPLFRRALEISKCSLGDKHPDAAVTLSNLARLYFRQNDFAAAAPLLLHLLSIKEEALGPNHPEVAAIMTSLAKVRAAEGDLDAAEQLRQRAAHLRGQSPNAAPGEGAAASLTVPLKPTAEPSVTPGKPAEPVLRSGGAPAPGSPASPTPSAGTARPASRPSGTAPRSGERTEPRTGPQHERTTKSTTLPWIEPPTSPALRRPMPPRALDSAEPVATPAAATIASTMPAPTVTRFAPPPQSAADKGRAASPRVEHASAEKAHQPAPLVVDQRADDSADVAAWTPAPRRAWVKVLAAAVVLLVLGAGSWVVFMEHPAVTGDATVSATGGSVALKHKAPQAPLDDHVSPAPVDPSPAETENLEPPATVESPPVISHPAEARAEPRQASRPNAPSVKAAETVADPKTVRAEARAVTAPARDEPAADPNPALPSIDVNVATSSITARAKQRVDSLGRTMTVKPPTFEKPKDKR